MRRLCTRQEGGGGTRDKHEGQVGPLQEHLHEAYQGDRMGIADQHAVRPLPGAQWLTEQARLVAHEIPGRSFEAGFVHVGAVVLHDDLVEIATLFGDAEAEVIGDTDS
mgnify:CR=1 FL=1